MALSDKAQAILDALNSRQGVILSGPTANNKSEAAAAWWELQVAGLVTESQVCKGVAKYEIATDGKHGEGSDK